MTESAGEVIRRHRERAKLSQLEVALAIRRSSGLISQYESDFTHPPRATAIQLDRLLDAGGEIITACGYVDLEIVQRQVTQPDQLRHLLKLFDDVTTRLASLEAKVGQALRELGELDERLGRPE